MFERIKEKILDLVNYCDCPFDPEDNPFPQSCDKRIIFTEECEKCSWRQMKSQDTDSKIKHCPFCGGQADIGKYGVSYPQFYVECKNCHARTENHVGYDEQLTMKHAIRDWNRRF